MEWDQEGRISLLTQKGLQERAREGRGLRVTTSMIEGEEGSRQVMYAGRDLLFISV